MVICQIGRAEGVSKDGIFDGPGIQMTEYCVLVTNL